VRRAGLGNDGIVTDILPYDSEGQGEPGFVGFHGPGPAGLGFTGSLRPFEDRR
jgi:hypothetical protein